MEDIHPGLVEGLAQALWCWSWTVDQEKLHKPYPYEKLIDATRDDLRAIAGGLLMTGSDRQRALLEIASIQPDCEQAIWMQKVAQNAIVK